jgi:hypothetical protein
MTNITVTLRKDSFREGLIKDIAKGRKGNFNRESLVGGEITLEFTFPSEEQCDSFQEECKTNVRLQNEKLVFGGIHSIDL